MVSVCHWLKVKFQAFIWCQNPDVQGKCVPVHKDNRSSQRYKYFFFFQVCVCVNYWIYSWFWINHTHINMSSFCHVFHHKYFDMCSCNVTIIAVFRNYTFIKKQYIYFSFEFCSSFSNGFLWSPTLEIIISWDLLAVEIRKWSEWERGVSCSSVSWIV